jgi:hypothetical protein
MTDNVCRLPVQDTFTNFLESANRELKSEVVKGAQVAEIECHPKGSENGFDAFAFISGGGD